MIHKQKTFPHARKYHSKIIQDLLDEITPLEQKQTDIKLIIAARIDDAMKEKHITKLMFAKKLNITEDDVAYILSGSRNLTIETLTEIAFILDVKLSSFFKLRNKYV